MRYLIETKLNDGTLVDTIAMVEGEAERDKILAELEAEREADVHGAIVGTVTVTQLQPPRRTILLHLNVAAHASDERDATDIAESFLAHSDAETLIEALTLAEDA